MNHPLLVKVCGNTSQKDLNACIRMGVHLCGFIFHSESSRFIEPSKAAVLHSGNIKRVGVFVDSSPEDIIRIMDQAHLHYAQLHGNYSNDAARQIGAHRVIRVLWPQRYDAVARLMDEMHAMADHCSFFLLDAGLQGGGSGKKIDWKTLHNIQSPRPWILAGGLSPANIPTALIHCHPNGIDINSIIELSKQDQAAYGMRKSPSLMLAALQQLHVHKIR